MQHKRQNETTHHPLASVLVRIGSRYLGKDDNLIEECVVHGRGRAGGNPKCDGVLDLGLVVDGLELNTRVNERRIKEGARGRQTLSERA
jgi:hypothetical protein